MATLKSWLPDFPLPATLRAVMRWNEFRTLSEVRQDGFFGRRDEKRRTVVARWILDNRRSRIPYAVERALERMLDPDPRFDPPPVPWAVLNEFEPLVP